MPYRKLLAALVGLVVGIAASSAQATTVQVFTDQPVSLAPFVGLGVQVDPYDAMKPTAVNWPLIEQRLDYMSPGIIRVVEPESDYFGGYDSSGNPTYRWTSNKMQMTMTILQWAKAHGVTVMLGDWADPLVRGDASVPIDFIQDLRTTYGFTNIRYYNVMNEPNDEVPALPFASWESIMRALSAKIVANGDTNWLTLVGPDNENSWDDDQPAWALDQRVGLDADNPLSGDAWVTLTLRAIASIVGAYDSHRYATVWGVENGIYGDQVRSRREEISNLGSVNAPYFLGEAGMTALQSTPFARDVVDRAELDPSQPVFGTGAAHAAAAGIDSQPNIATFNYGVWMADMMVQGINAGLSGASAWDLDDAMHNGGGYGALNLKRWGFFNTLGGQDGYPSSDLNLRPWFFTWSTLSRAFPAGSQPLVLPTTDVPGLRVAAARIPSGNGYDLSFAVVNDSDSAHQLTLSVPSVAHAVTFGRYDYFSGTTKTDTYGFPAPAAVQSLTPSAGIPVSLPSRGVVVLTTRGFGSAVSPAQGAGTVTDPMQGFSVPYLHSDSLTVDRSDPPRFNYDAARVTPKGKRLSRQGYLEYKASQMTSFTIKTYFKKALGVQAFVSEDGSDWWQVPLSHSAASPTVGGGESYEELFSALPLPAGLNRLKLLVNSGTELANVRIASQRTGPACLATELPATPDKLGGVSPGFNRIQVLGSIGPASSTVRSASLYCVNRGGQLAAVFDSGGQVEAVVSTAPAFHPGQGGIGTSLTDLEAKLGPSRIAATGHGLLVSTAGVVYVIRNGAVSAIALAQPTLRGSLGQLAGAIRRSSLV